MDILADPGQFSAKLFERMVAIQPGVTDLELYEFRYLLDNVTPEEGWDSVKPAACSAIEAEISRREFFEKIQLKPIKNHRITLDETIVHLTQMLFVGLISGEYSVEWINRLFYFDIRGFIFFVRTDYFNDAIRAHYGNDPFIQYVPEQKALERCQDLGYGEISKANHLIDHAFLDTLKKVLCLKGIPLLITLVGPSGAGKTEIVTRLERELAAEGKRITTIEMDRFFKDREYRDGKPMGPDVIHFDLFKKGMEEILLGRKISIPTYDFVRSTSSHDLQGNLRPGCSMEEVKPADIILLEGNFPFHIPEIAPLIGLKIVYLTDDPIRLKRKWKRDIDYRKKYDPLYLCNRYFSTQFLRAQEVYLPMMEVSDILVDTTSAALWLTPQMAALLRTYQD